MSVAIPQLLALRCVSMAAVARWVFEQPDISHSAFLWDILILCTKKQLGLLRLSANSSILPGETYAKDASALFELLCGKFTESLVEHANQSVYASFNVIIIIILLFLFLYYYYYCHLVVLLE